MYSWEWIAIGVFVAAGSVLLFEHLKGRYKRLWRKRWPTPMQKAKKHLQERSGANHEQPIEITQVWPKYDHDSEENGV